MLFYPWDILVPMPHREQGYFDVHIRNEDVEFKVAAAHIRASSLEKH